MSETPLTLNSRPQDFIEALNWPISPSDPLSNINLRQLLSFTSGLTEEPTCITPGLPFIDFATCVKNIATANANNGFVPGAKFYYSGSHLQVAGLMTINARNKAKKITTSTWQDLVTDFKSKTNLFPNSVYNLPSMSNPRLAAGMRWTGDDYFNFVKSNYFRKALSEVIMPGQTKTLQDLQFSDQTNNAIMANSPIFNGTGEDWHYGFGLWLECRSPSYNCGTTANSYSSPGSYGAYPFINKAHKFYGILARQGSVSTFRKGYELYSNVENQIIKWVDQDCK